ncbi:MAG TPA: hypothetical protein VHN15_14680 [Thermoanaerobaculia bacterium]|nr:hypothetical protein [Thermoanaerobaculia bacterium]
MKIRKTLPFALAAALLFGGAVSAEELRGRVQLLAKGGKEPARGSDARQAVVYFEPVSPQPVRPPAEPFVMTTRKKEFVPRVLAIPRGSRVRFPNEDLILHNVFSVSGGNSFDLGLYRAGAGKDKRFTESGLVRVYCNVHHDMVAYVLVLDTPYFVSPEANGEFVLTGLPKGRGRLTIWHEQAEPFTMDLQLPAASPVLGRLEVTRPQVPPHLNKSGQSYFRRDRYKNR